MSRTEPFLIAAVAAALLVAGRPAYAAPHPARCAAPAQAALQSLTDTSHAALPQGTRVLGVSIQNGLATVNFNRALTDNFRGGDSEAADTVNAVLQTMGRFPNVSRVQILEAGQAPDAMGGLIDLSTPLPVIRPHALLSSSVTQP